MTPSGRLLLDTHVFIWWRSNSPLLGREARAAIASADLVFVSVASAWEAAIKIALGKLRLPESFEVGVIASRFERLPIAFAHAEAVASLPHHHTDPFDRMLVVQCLSERLTLVTHDRRLAAYGVDIVWA
ncbi:MAG TPA: type II toxin-antitoxin system VapC family toxin [Geminicoccaceae bacterium]|jgi:PIN domain nuclease of toxin-antitoxin system|nr:type II toxin-antitoxin system VapC family toxin [Geminicoccaceae bacterium]